MRKGDGIEQPTFQGQVAVIAMEKLAKPCRPKMLYIGMDNEYWVWRESYLPHLQLLSQAILTSLE